MDNKEFKDEETIDNFDSGLSKYIKKDEIDISIFNGMELNFSDYWKYNPDNPEADHHDSDFRIVNDEINSLLRENVTLSMEQKYLFVYLFYSRIYFDREYIYFIFGIKNKKNLVLESYKGKYFCDTHNVESLFNFVLWIANSNMDEDLKLAIKDEENMSYIESINDTNIVENNYKKKLYDKTVSKKIGAYLELLTVLTKVQIVMGKWYVKIYLRLLEQLINY
ncbi:hypothetical protein I6H46_07195 [Anaerococcus obesiensis]|uniref:Uncharacterized protein n=1 Tax=Anaerococcus obesiensis TaxID=1287640 RepID=A0A7T7ZV30_9FIRM|nr:hypothetical protein [Anaerococcus obesiensis]QQN55659.1 hypothetical protein I6H46_07195 [Anaerococcus obesiensis]